MTTVGQSPPSRTPVKEKSSSTGTWIILVMFLLGAGALIYLATRKKKPDLILNERRALKPKENTSAEGNELFRGDVDETTCLQQATALEEAWDFNPELQSIGAVSFNPEQRPSCRVLDRSAEVGSELGTTTWIED